MKRLGKAIAEKGGFLRSGGADGADNAFLSGIGLFEEPSCKNCRIYLPWDGYNDFIASEGSPFVIARHLETITEALELAFLTRGSFIGLGRGGISLHGRNPYQILGDDLNSPADLVILYSKPTKTGVSGGTNTAYKIALKNNVPVLNLYKPEDREKALDIMTLPSIVELKTFAQELQREQYPHCQSPS